MANITVFRGDTIELDLTITTGSNSGAANLSGADIYFTIKKSPSDPDSKAVVKKETPAASGITVTNTGQGLATVNIPTGDSYYFQTGPYYYGIQLKDVSNNVFTIVTGLFNVKADVTRRV